MKVIIIGGVAGGATAAARLRRLDEKAEIILFEKDEYISFANCGLPYYIGGEIKEKSALTLQTPESFNARFNVDVRNFSEVIKINRDVKTVIVKSKINGSEYEESYDKIVYAPGASPIVPPFEGSNLDKVFTLRNIPDTYKIKDYIDNNNPKSAVIVGGGYIGMEMAENLVSAGVITIIVEMANQVIAPVDYEMAAEVHEYVRAKGIDLHLNTAINSIREEDGRLIAVTSKEEIPTDMVILAIGVKPDTKLAKESGLEINERGYVVVDDHMLSSDDSIYAVGDAIEITDFNTKQKAMIPLAGPANKQGRIAADNICSIPSIYKQTQGSAILKIFDMTVATTGINEKTAQRIGLAYDKIFTYSASHASYYPGAQMMSIKTIFEKVTGKILGSQIVGFDGTDKRADVMAVAIRAGMTAHDLTNLELCYAPPFSSAKDPVNMAGYAIENVISNKVSQFHWHDVEKYANDENNQLLDVRTSYEYENGSIHGFKNIPVDELRNRLEELDKTRPIYLTCQIGLRGYIATRILSQNGFTVYNLSGGYRQYNVIKSDRSHN